jgi:hypothetical protein
MKSSTADAGITFVAGRPFMSGDVFYKLAMSAHEADRKMYIGYVLGVLDTASANGTAAKGADGISIFAGSRWCTRDDVTLRQVLDVVFRFLEEFPELRDYPALALVGKALAEAWPCK